MVAQSRSRRWFGSMRFARFIVYSRLVRNPVDFPSLASVIGERLFKVRRTRGHVRPNKSNQDNFAVNRILGEKLAASILEFADLGWIQDAILAVGPIEPPLVGLRIVQPESQAFDVARSRTINLDRVQLSAAVPNLVALSSTVKLDPGIGTG